MLINEMTKAECLHALARSRLGRLGCAHNHQPYVVPMYFAYHEMYLYAFATLGQKIEWMRENPCVCLEVDEITSHFEWMSVLVVGHYEELPDTPANKLERLRAYESLQTHAMWWQPAYVASLHQGAAELVPIFFRIRIDQVTGHRALPDSVEAATLTAPARPPKSEGWLSSLLRRTGITS